MSLLKAAVAAGGLLAPLKGKYNEQYGEWDQLAYGPIKFLVRDASGRPRVLGIPFPRWARGPRS